MTTNNETRVADDAYDKVTYVSRVYEITYDDVVKLYDNNARGGEFSRPE